MSELSFGMLALAVTLLVMTAAWVHVHRLRVEVSHRKQTLKDKRLEAALAQQAAMVRLHEQSMQQPATRRGPLAS
jgi:hypothetical protein